MSPEHCSTKAAKILYTTDDPEILLSHFKMMPPPLTPRSAAVSPQWEINCTISTALFQYLEEWHPNSLYRLPQSNQMRVRALQFCL